MDSQTKYINVTLNNEFIKRYQLDYIKNLASDSDYIKGFLEMENSENQSINITTNSIIINSLTTESKYLVISASFVLLHDDLYDSEYEKLEEYGVDTLVGILLINDFLCPINENNFLKSNKIEDMVITSLMKSNDNKWVDILIDTHNIESLKNKIIVAHIIGSLNVKSEDDYKKLCETIPHIFYSMMLEMNSTIKEYCAYGKHNLPIICKLKIEATKFKLVDLGYGKYESGFENTYLVMKLISELKL